MKRIDRISLAALFANLLEQARAHAAAKKGIEHVGDIAFGMGLRNAGDAETEMNLLQRFGVRENTAAHLGADSPFTLNARSESVLPCTTPRRAPISSTSALWRKLPAAETMTSARLITRDLKKPRISSRLKPVDGLLHGRKSAGRWDDPLKKSRLKDHAHNRPAYLPPGKFPEESPIFRARSPRRRNSNGEKYRSRDRSPTADFHRALWRSSRCALWK